MLLGISGLPGSFSEEAGLQYAKKAGISLSLVYLMDMKTVLAAVEQGSVDLGIFPVVNFKGGLVNMAFEAMGEHRFTWVDELWLDVHQCLLVHAGTKRDHIKQIISHPQALSQCQDYLRRSFKDIELIEWEDTAKAAKDLAEGTILKSTTAVIAPAASARMYNLEIFDENIQDNHPNFTIFIIVKGRNL